MRNNDPLVLEMTKKQHQTEYVCRSVFKRSGALSYLGHLDLMGVFERAVRRSGLPMLYSQGFNPRPMMVFALPLGVGIDTEGDVIDISMSVPVTEDEFLKAIVPQLPEDLQIVRTISIDEPKNSLMSVVTAAKYRMEGKDIAKYVSMLFKMSEVLVEKKNKKKEIVKTDIRNLMYEVTDAPSDDVINIVVAAGSASNLRPDLLIQAAVSYFNMPEADANGTIFVRTGLFGGEYPELKDVFDLV